MIDTVRYEQRWELYQEFWGIFLVDKKLGIRAGANGSHLTWFEFSLPKLLFGENSRLIESQAQIEKAFAKADDLISRWASPTQDLRRFTRVDLVWHFRANPPQEFLFAHQACNHPEIKKAVVVIRNNHTVNTVEWRGDRMRIRMYDKTSKRAKIPRQVVRAEIQLRGRKLTRKLNRGGQIYHLKLKDCYAAYRATLRKFKQKKTLKIGSKDEALFYAETKGIRVFDRLTQTMSTRSTTRLRKKFSDYLLKRYKIDWEKLLPKKSLPLKFDAGETSSPMKFNFQSAKAKNGRKVESEGLLQHPANARKRP